MDKEFKHYPYKTPISGERDPNLQAPPIASFGSQVKGDADKPVLQVSIMSRDLNKITAGGIQMALLKLSEMYAPKYNIIITPADSVNISTSDNNVVRLDLHDEETIKNFCKIMDEESWRIKKEDENDTPKVEGDMAGSN